MLTCFTFQNILNIHIRDARFVYSMVIFNVNDRCLTDKHLCKRQSHIPLTWFSPKTLTLRILQQVRVSPFYLCTLTKKSQFLNTIKILGQDCQPLSPPKGEEPEYKSKQNYFAKFTIFVHLKSFFFPIPFIPKYSPYLLDSSVLCVVILLSVALLLFCFQLPQVNPGLKILSG